jgi:two-component system, OmpR family, sensor kinase
MKHWYWGLLVAVPAVLGGLLVAIFWFGWLPNAVVYLRADFGTIFGLLGLFFVLGLGFEWARWAWQKRNQHTFVSKLQADSTNERHEFLRRLDHELKNPLMAMRAGLANLNGTNLEPQQREIIGSVETQTLRLSRLLADLRKLAELTTRPLDCAPVDMSDLLQEVLAVTEERREAAGRRLTLTLPQAPWPLSPVPGDRDLLFLLFHNLLDNALKFTQPGKTIEIRAFEDGARVVVEVADTGPGIPEKEVPLVWNELYRGENARGVPGSGIGLALVRAIVERHHGEVFLRSRVGQGTVFTLRLPAYQK